MQPTANPNRQNLGIITIKDDRHTRRTSVNLRLFFGWPSRGGIIVLEHVQNFESFFFSPLHEPENPVESFGLRCRFVPRTKARVEFQGEGPRGMTRALHSYHHVRQRKPLRTSLPRSR